MNTVYTILIMYTIVFSEDHKLIYINMYIT